MLYERQLSERVAQSESVRQAAKLQAVEAERTTVLEKLKQDHKAELEKLERENTDLRRQLADAIESAKPAPTPAEVAERVRAVRELAFTRMPEWTPAPPEEILQKLSSQAASQITPEESSARARAMVAMGFVTEPFDYRTVTGELAQIRSGGFFDPAASRFLYQKDASLARADSREAFAGALLPVLIGQNFPAALPSAPPVDPENDDASRALRALASGDASFFRVYFALGDKLRANNDRGQGPTPPLQPTAPQFMAEMLKWTEDSGNLFVTSLHMKGGVTAVNNAYARPPRSSAEILHPEQLYLANPPFEPVKVSFGDTSINGTAPFFSNVAGEAAMFFLVRGWADVDTAETATVGWAGDRYAVWAGAKEYGDHVLWRTVWTTDKDAEEFFATLRTGLMSRHLIPWQKEYDVTPGQFRVDDPHRIIRLVRDGKTVTLIDATDAAFAQAAAEKFLNAR